MRPWNDRQCNSRTIHATATAGLRKTHTKTAKPETVPYGGSSLRHRPRDDRRHQNDRRDLKNDLQSQPAELRPGRKMFQEPHRRRLPRFSAWSIIARMRAASSLEDSAPMQQGNQKPFGRTAEGRLDQPADHRSERRISRHRGPVSMGMLERISLEPPLLLQPRKHRQYRVRATRRPAESAFHTSATVTSPRSQTTFMISSSPPIAAAAPQVRPSNCSSAANAYDRQHNTDGRR